ncbi:hypothetical protein OIU78_005497 [Salix suchowensis]|uniref:Uncharacterized protein n=1 Tax=Salix purpurea TaxID=77065 RepID=A0A9Q0TU44_SALPP|nr:hypothetical protein OIU78_005497 [Salix suchowensis]KAJ6717952.1 hypothetical protein OIU79_005979 [Salix purpurea]
MSDLKRVFWRWGRVKMKKAYIQPPGRHTSNLSGIGLNSYYSTPFKMATTESKWLFQSRADAKSNSMFKTWTKENTLVSISNSFLKARLAWCYCASKFSSFEAATH